MQIPKLQILIEAGVVRAVEVAYASESAGWTVAITYASCQGLTLPGVVMLGTKSDHFTMKHLYVGLSRATAADLVEVC
jgi:hypothetical protein